MSRSQHVFACAGDRLGATLDAAAGSTGLLWVTGGNEIRAGAFNGQSLLAAEIAAAGHPVLRFDRRGVGDSEGENRGFRHAGPDIAAARAALAALQPQLTRIVAFGNCDAASALMLAHGAGCDALVLSNPWTLEDDAAAGDGPAPAPMPASAIRARYAAKLANPRELWRLLSGGVDVRKLARGLVQAAAPAPAPSTLARELRAGLAAFGGTATILLAEADRTAQLFAQGWDAADPRLRRCPGAGHAYAEPAARAWLKARLLEALSA